MKNQCSQLERSLGLSLLLGLLIPIASAQQTCETRRSEELSTQRTYHLASPRGEQSRSLVISCTDVEDEIRISLRNKKTRKSIQTFTETQNQNYLEATTPDLDGDGYADLVLITDWGGPNMEFKAWRYDPARDRLKLALETIGTAFVRAKNGRLISVGKGGADLWGYTTYKWNSGGLVPEYSIDETAGRSECDYANAAENALGKTIAASLILKELKSYCGMGTAGVIENGQDLLSSTVDK